MSLSAADINKIAKLSRIRLKEDQVSFYQKELSGILDWIDMLQEVDTSNVPAMTSVSHQTLPLRTDQVTDGSKCDDILKNAPRAEFNCFVVPKVVE